MSEVNRREYELNIIDTFKSLGYQSESWETEKEIELLQITNSVSSKLNYGVIIFIYLDRKEIEKVKVTIRGRIDGDNQMTYGDWVKFKPEELKVLDRLGFTFVKGFEYTMNQSMEDWF